MKLRVLASAAIVAIALATTGCGSHLANNASRLNRTVDGASRYGTTRYSALENGLVRNNTTIESGGRLGHTGRIGNYRTGNRGMGYRTGYRTGHGGTRYTARFANSTRPVGRRLGNAVHSTRGTHNTHSQIGAGHVRNERIGNTTTNTTHTPTNTTNRSSVNHTNRHPLNQNNLHSRDGRSLGVQRMGHNTGNAMNNADGIRNTVYNYDNSNLNNTGFTRNSFTDSNLNRPYLNGDMSVTNNSVNRTNFNTTPSNTNITNRFNTRTTGNNL